MVTPDSPSPYTPRRNSLIRGCFFRYSFTAPRSFPVPMPCTMRTSEMPAALVECGYMSTPAELALLLQPEYQLRLARGIADGVLAYLAQGAQPGRILGWLK